MNKKACVNAQNIFLNCLRTSGVKVTIFLASGKKLFGIIKGYDEFTVVLENENTQTLIYKSNISSIQPSKELKPIKQGYDNVTPKVAKA